MKRVLIGLAMVFGAGTAYADTDTFTSTATPTATATRTSTSTATATRTATSTRTRTATRTSTLTRTATPTGLVIAQNYGATFRSTGGVPQSSPIAFFKTTGGYGGAVDASFLAPTVDNYIIDFSSLPSGTCSWFYVQADKPFLVTSFGGVVPNQQFFTLFAVQMAPGNATNDLQVTTEFTNTTFQIRGAN